MGHELEDAKKSKKKGSKLRNIYRLALVIVGVIAISKELQKPADERTWHGKVGNFIPYDFRIPTLERLRNTYWNPDAPLVSGKAFGVGWAPNFGAIKRMIT